MPNAINRDECKIAVLCGGKSEEREVSLNSGKAVSEALKGAGYDVTTLDPASKEDLKQLIDGDFTVAFLCTHGRYGEDGTLQGFLEIVGIPYTGSGVLASATAMNKCRAKETYRLHNLPTLPSLTIEKGEGYSIDEIVEKLGDHCVIKAAKEGSSIGLYIEEGSDAIAAAIEKALGFDDEVLVERYCKARELTVGVLGNDNPEALPVIEIVPKEGFYDYEAKYAPGGSKHLCPAPLDEELSQRIRATAEAAHAALGCKGESRTDFLLEEDGTFWILETNTLPGMTETSLLPDAASKKGMSFAALCEHLIGLALEDAAK